MTDFIFYLLFLIIFFCFATLTKSTILPFNLQPFNLLIMTEIQIQAACYLWFHNEFPSDRGLLCYNLGNSKNAIDGNKNKALGLQAGRSDLVYYFAGRANMIEIKDATGRQSEKQKEWQRLVEANGFKYHICRSLEEFKAIIEHIRTETPQI